MNRTLDDRPRTPDAPAPVLGARPPAARTASAVPRPAGRALLAGAVVAGPLFLAAGVAQGVTRRASTSRGTRSASSRWGTRADSRR